MATTRQDAWTDDEDLLLAEVVLRHIREGGTQLSAFKEVGRHLSRTPAACGFRWNSYVRKQYKERIEEAKQLRKVEHYEVKETKVLEPKSITLNDVIDFLQNYKDENSLMVLQQQIESLQTEKKVFWNDYQYMRKNIEHCLIISIKKKCNGSGKK